MKFFPGWFDLSSAMLSRRVLGWAAATAWLGAAAGCGLGSKLSNAGTTSSTAKNVMATMTAGSADALVDSIGVNVHFNYYGSIYTDDTPRMIQSLQILGVRHLRDALCWQGPESWNTYYVLHQQLGALGFRTDYIAYIGQPMSQVAAYPGLVPDMEAIEPANEYDNSGDTNWVSAISAQQAAIYNTIAATPAAAGVTVLAPSLAYPSNAAELGNLASNASAGNLHGYFSGYNPGSAAMNPSLLMAQVKQNAVSRPVWVTETGYFANPGPIFGMYGVTEAVQAIYSPRALMEYWNAGAARTYLYELADDVEAGENPVDYHWGLLDSTGAVKPAFTALSNLVGLLADPGPTFTPAPLAGSIQGSAGSVHTALLGKRDGSYVVVVWNEVQSYDFVNNVPLNPAAQTVTLTLGKMPISVSVQQFDAAGNVAAKLVAAGQTLTLPVTDKLQMIALRF